MRLFIAVELDDEAKDAIAVEQQRLASAMRESRASLKWVKRDQMHLTLVFLGEVPDASAQPIVDAMNAPIARPAFDAVFEGIGVFPPDGSERGRKPPRVLWLGVAAGADAVTAVQREVVARMTALGAEKLLGPLPVTDGPAAGQTINYFRTPFGLYVELISYPGGMNYEATAATKLWNPADVGARIDEILKVLAANVDLARRTVADVAKASRWLEDTLGCTTPLVFGPFSGVGALVDVSDDAVIEQIRELRCGENGANLELFQYRAPGQDRTVPLNSDYAGNHVAFYVRDIAAATAAMSGRGARPFLGPFPITDGPAAGQSINYYLPPIQHYLELISYPAGMAYETGAETVLWSPRNPTG